MAKEWQTFVRKFSDMKEGEVELFIKDLTPGPGKYDTKHVRAKVTSSKASLPDGEILWIRSESGTMAPEPFYMSITEELPEYVKGKPWEDVFNAIDREQKKRT